MISIITVAQVGGAGVYGRDIGVLLAMFVFLRTCVYVALRYL